MKKLQMNKKLYVLICLLAFPFLITGCTNYAKQYDSNTLVVSRNGSLVEISVEDFKEAAVGADNISAYVEEQVDNYNNNAGNKIKVKSINTDNLEHVKLVLSYKDIESYDEFNLLEYSLKDISDVKEEDLTGSYTSADEKKTNPSDIIAEEKGKILTISEATDVVIKGSIMYYNGEVTVKDGIATTSGKNDAVIVFK